MPLSDSFKERLYPLLPYLQNHFGTPFHIYDEAGIKRTGDDLNKAFSGVRNFREYYAAKALPNPAILKIMTELGFGFDCSSITELILSRQIGAQPDDLMFTSNNTSPEEFAVAAAAGGCILNLDDMEKATIERALRKHGFNISRAAAELGLTRASLYRRMEKHGI